MKQIIRAYSPLFLLSFLLIIMSCSTEDVKPSPPPLGTFSVPAKRIGSLPFDLTPPSSPSSGAFSYTSSNTSVATISGSTITVVGIGSTTITAIQEADVRFTSGTATAILVVTELEPPTFGTFFVPSKITASPPFDLTPPTSNSAGSFSYTSSNETVATISGSTVTVVGAGTTTITATQAAFGTFASASTSATFTVSTSTIPDASIASANFDAVAGSALADNGWFAHSNIITNPILITSPGLTFPNYYGSGIGNAAAVTSTGQDVSLQFAEVTTGTVYASFLINATASPLCVDQYFFAFGNNNTADTAYRGKLLINQDPVNPTKFKFGFAANLSIKSSPVLYDYGTTYLVVIKYKIIDAATTNGNGNVGRDETSLYVFDSSADFLTEPTIPTIGIEDTASVDIIPGRVVLRQDNTNSPNVIIDGLRVDNNWVLRN